MLGFIKPKLAIQEHPLKLAIALPWWQIVTVLLGFPLLYFVNHFTPWCKGLFVKRDHGFFIPFYCSILVLHWISVALVVMFVWQAGGGLTDIGLQLSAGKAAVMAGVFLAVATTLVLLRQTRPANYPSRLGWIRSYCCRLIWSSALSGCLPVLRLVFAKSWFIVVLVFVPCGEMGCPHGWR
jgi:hypothetical protein